MTAQICAQFVCGFRWFQVEPPLKHPAAHVIFTLQGQ